MERKRQLQKREFGKRFSLDSSLVEYMDSNKYIEHLVTQLEEQRWNLWREKLSVARLQREVARNKSEGTMRERLIHELEEERHLRLESEKRLREVTLESERSRAQMHGLQQQFSRMEETVRNLLQNQGPTDQNGERTVDIMKVYQEKLSEDKNHKETMEDVHTTADEGSRSESSSAEEEKEKTKLLLQRLKALEAENSALALENENQRQQYERCLDEVANQVVQALLTQKDLREECIKLKTRVFDLEQQNRTLSVLFQQRVKPASDLLLQKLHSRILDLSSGDLLSEVERNRSLMQSRTADVQIHECQQNVKAGIPALKCQSQLNITGSSRLYPRSSCSSSELSLSSACSEYSSGSSYTWNDGKTCSKRSSISWDQRISIGSSFPSNLSSPADDLPPTRIKENHILEGLKKLQKRKILLESPSVISKWGYKDCMDSNEGIYSPGIKCGSHKEQVHSSWFGFRKSKLPALSSRKTEAPKTKVEKKDSKGSTLGNKQAKLEKKKDKKKTEQHCEAENEFNRKTENGNILDDVLKGRKNTKPSQDALSQIRCEQKNSSSTIPYSAKDGFMKELLNRSVSKGSSQGSSLPSNSISTQGSHKKNSKTKADMEMQNQTLTKDVTENQHEDEEDIMTNKTCQSHVIESCCQMRTLDSGIGTFPLPDSGNRSTARHVSKQESTLETEVFTSPEEVLPSAPSVKAKTLEREVPSTAKSQGSVESIISHSTSDPTMTAKNIRPFQSRLPKPASSGMINLTKQDGQEQSSVSSASLEQTEKPVETKKILPDWTSKKTTKSKDRTLRVCTYSASSNSDTETETEYETNEFGTEEEKLVELTQNNKQVEQEERSVRKSFIGNPMSILDLYQHSLYGHYGEDGPEQLTHYSFIEQLSGTSSKDGKNKDIPSKLKQTEETEEDSENRLSKISLESLNKFNSNNMILLEKEKNCLNKVEGQKEVNGKNEDASLNSSDRHGVDNLESLSDSLYDSFSSCASQGSNDV
ncbi:nck-associated protein 5 isoform B [Alligator mississippiensis]|uniref:Nck-associated protein 5 isoform B n=1 Tax=Alligator mississippiensis TaxID=8496 RepID=A0A151M0R4_ALLMI|nr:nck-associated protein 5 isoform B [Alligator mississippiensis]